MWAIIGLALGDKLPFQCPYKIPEEDPQPSATGEEGGGLIPTLFEDGGLDDVNIDVYAQYRAALALVPCDAKPVSVFTEKEMGSNYSISVIFVYDKTVEDLKRWLE